MTQYEERGEGVSNITFSRETFKGLHHATFPDKTVELHQNAVIKNGVRSWILVSISSEWGRITGSYEHVKEIVSLLKASTIFAVSATICFQR
jgi:hypothetical protein